MLVLADVSEAKELLALQHSAFAALYETYHDRYNPAIESLGDFVLAFLDLIVAIIKSLRIRGLLVLFGRLWLKMPMRAGLV